MPMRLVRRDVLRLFATSLLSSGALGATACKKPDSGPAPGASSGAAPAESTGEIVIGHYASMTGSKAHFGQDTDKAVRVAVEEINQAGGIGGRKVKLVTLDTRGDTAEAANAVSRLIDVEKVVAILGEVASSLSLAGGRVAQRRKIPMVSPSSTNPKVTQVGDYIFRVCFLDPFQGKVMATFAKKNLNFDKVAVLKDVKNDYSIGLAEAFKSSFEAVGGKITVEQSYSAGDTDFSAQLTAIKAAAPQAIFVPGYYTEVGSIAEQSRRLGMKVPLLGGDGWDAPDLFKIAKGALEGSYYSTHFATDVATPKAKKFVTDFKAKYGIEPTALGALGYDAAAVLFDAMKRAKSVTPTEIRDALATTKNFDGVSGAITIDPERNAQKSAVVLKLEGDKAKYETSISP
jgi:branched-chain amino acid transport system substrate-binding protein